jgi:hypothetical protein
VSLELGGKSTVIVLDDAVLDLAKVGQSLFTAALANNGQVGFLGTRIPEGFEGFAAYQELKSVYRLVRWATARRRRRPSAR